MSEPDFDQAAADAALEALAGAILGDTHYRDRDWEVIVLVFELGERTSEAGYLFGPGALWSVEAPEDWAVLDRARAFHAATQRPGEPRWRRCLIRIVRDPRRVEAEFDAEGTRWIPDAADPEGFARSLRGG